MNDVQVIGWDIGGAHLKAALLEGGVVADVVQLPCALWLGDAALERAIQAVRARWPRADAAHHAVTMTGEMVDRFAHREAGVQRIAALMAGAFDGVQFFAGDSGWCRADQAGAHWQDVASANWLACARHVATALPDRAGVLVDIGSTTTDLIAFRGGRVLSTSRSDAQRLARSELVYQGVVRTPLCVLGQRMPWRGADVNVMNELFATSADVYRLTGELDPAFDQHASADGAPKDAAASRQRLARLIGLDARDGGVAEWLALAHVWRSRQLAELRGQLERVRAEHNLTRGAVLVSAGCGAFLASALAPAGAACLPYARDVARFAGHAPPGTAAWAQVCAPSVAVAALFERERLHREPLLEREQR
jgi:(4-(4-[2-(gamma-L-glutamylamino)ethyl]phenoxymethyl)furan-2-yl)methanamine synthase